MLIASLGVWLFSSVAQPLTSTPSESAPSVERAQAPASSRDEGPQWPTIAAGCLGVAVGAWLARRRISNLRE